jgi:hypothetical protein
VNFDWVAGSPDPGISADNFSVRWTRCLDMEAGNYIFTASGDDHIQIFLDDLLVLETSFPVERAVPVTAGHHCLKVEYREVRGRAHLNFSYAKGTP